MNNYFFPHKVVKCKHYTWWYGPSNIKVQSLHCLYPLRMPTMANTPHEKPLIFQLSALVSLPTGKSSTRVWERVRVQWAQGGAGPQGEGKWRVNEVQFWMKHFSRADYSLFNELAPSPSSSLHRHHQTSPVDSLPTITTDYCLWVHSPRYSVFPHFVKLHTHKKSLQSHRWWGFSKNSKPWGENVQKSLI